MPTTTAVRLFSVVPLVLAIGAAPEPERWPTGLPPQDVHGPRLNQVGFLPRSPKRFTINAADAAPGAPFSVQDQAGKPALSGALAPLAVDETRASGERVLVGDFSRLRRDGTYTLVVGSFRSPPFRIATSLYAPLYRDAARTFYLNQSGPELSDPVSGIAHKPSHLRDAQVDAADGRTELRDLTGGWYNAGDFGKWTPMAAISASYLMLLDEVEGGPLRRVSLDIPEGRARESALLALARWGLVWLLRMQNADGSVLHKIDSGPDFAFGKLPEDDPLPRKAGAASSVDAGDFAAVMLQAARVYAKGDPAFAARCRAAADRAWRWLRAHPNVLHDDPYYPDPDPSDERLWALAESVCTSGSAALGEEFEQEAERKPLVALEWSTPQILGYYHLARSANAPSGARELARREIVRVADEALAMADASGYGVALTPSEYYWGSLEVALHRAAALLFAHELTGEERYRDGAQQQLDYALGRNALGISFVTGYGANRVMHPYHWTYAALGKVVPGLASGGPNGSPDEADPLLAALQKKGTPPARCFIDGYSWSSNEGQITEQAALVFVAGSLAARARRPAASPQDGWQ